MEDLPVHHGYLLTPPQGKLLKRVWQKKYYALYKASNYAVERVEVFDSEEAYTHATSKQIIPLNDCVKVTQVPQKNQQNVFEVITKKQVYQFSTETTQSLAEWLEYFRMVAFPGLNSPTSLGPGVGSISLHSSPSNSLNLKAEEEENQIYGSWPEAHFIQIVDTEASIACGLKGNYILILSPLHLLLYENGTNATSQEPLYVWPYRHIRRYGRNKDAFTFEAGRKCSSGEGTFTFATREANFIFLTVQSNTRALKLEREDVMNFAPGLLLNKSVYPSVSKSQPELDTKTSKSDQGGSSGESSFQRKTSHSSLRSKITPPFAKPPRKTKLPSVGDDKSPTEPIRLELSNAARVKLATEAGKNTLSGKHQQPMLSPIEPTYAVPEVRRDAWKTFGLEADNIHSEKVPDVPDECSKPSYYSFVPLPASVQFPGKDQVNRILTPVTKKTSDNNDDYCYDHLSQFGNLQTAKSPDIAPDGHIYSRLISVTSLSEQSNNNINNSSNDQDYEDISGPEAFAPEKPSSTVNIGKKANEREDIKHFLQNEDVYTVVTKKSLKQSNSKN